MKVSITQLIYLLAYFYFALDIYWSIPANYTYLKLVAALAFIFPLIAFIHTANLKLPGIMWLNELTVIVFSGFAFIFLVNMLALLLPNLPKALPPGVISYYQLENLEEVRNRTVEYLDKSPFVKFKANVLARSQGFRGDTTQFVYIWQTDEWGFKNKAGKTKDSCQVLFLGNSFTEGMGVAIPHTLPAQFEHISGLSSYNLGVQGYAPTQMLGTYDLYADKLNPERVFLVYYSTIFERENNFRDLRQVLEEKKFTGGIGNISEQENQREIKADRQSNRIISAILIFAYVQMRERGEEKEEEKVNISDIQAINPVFKEYFPEIKTANSGHYEALIESIKQKDFAWQQTLSILDQLQARCQISSRQFTLVYIPRRAIVYGKALVEGMVEQTYIDDVERMAFDKYCQEKGIEFIDPTEELISLIRQTKNRIESKAALPYLPIDRHMSPVGYKEVATFIFKHLSLSTEKE